jgi:hypothetical protein
MFHPWGADPGAACKVTYSIGVVPGIGTYDVDTPKI